LKRFCWVLYPVGGAAFFILAVWMRVLSYFSDPLFYTYLQILGCLISFTYAANALVRFRGTHDRISLILAFGFVLSGLIEMASMFGFYSLLAAGQELHVPLVWMVSRTLLAVLLVAAVVVERRLPNARDPDREIAGAFLVVAAAAYLTSAVYLAAPAVPTIHPAALVARPWDLLPAGIFLVAAIQFHRRLRVASTAFDHCLYWAAVLNVGCHIVASQSERLLDAPFILAHGLKVTSYALVLCGALLDNARLFEQVRHLAASDPLTGLANYRRLVSALESEIQRSRRTGRPFAVLLLDLDRLKTINDRYGHLVGSRALNRLANVLRVHCRAALDTAARYGGDEFALVLPEAGSGAAERVAQRICERLADDGESPPISVSVGTAIFPRDGDTLEKLLGAADEALYRMKGRASGVMNISRIAACL
jgi:diguanylate cyclase (GGDEF)-like protein